MSENILISPVISLQDRIYAPKETSFLRDKFSQQKLVQYNFNASAKTYIKSAHIQKEPALKIIHNLPKYHGNGFVLDLGSGPGTMRYCSNGLHYECIFYDLSLNMLKNSGCYINDSVTAVNGDASFLPFASNSIPTVISNLMLQWSQDKLQVLREVKRVLVSEGMFMFTTLIRRSLWQLQVAFSQLDDNVHTLDFLGYEEYMNLIKQAGLKIIHANSWENMVNFSDIYALMRHFKLTGTSLPKSNMGKGLRGSGVFGELEAAYPKKLTDKTLPLSYQYLFMIVKRDE